MRLLIAGVIGLSMTAGTVVSAGTIIVPPGFENTGGGFGGFSPFLLPGPAPVDNGLRNQLVFNGSLFGGVSTPISITEIAFRPIDGVGFFSGDTITVSDLLIRLSTTGRSGNEAEGGLSATFADNIGADVTTVFSGPLKLMTVGGSPGPFDYRIVLQSAFVFDPSMGNLLLDFFVPTDGTVRGNGVFGNNFARFDTVNNLNDGVFQVSNVLDGSAAAGTLDTSGPITEFTFSPAEVGPAVPEPGTLALLATGGIGLVGGAIRKRRKTKQGV